MVPRTRVLIAEFGPDDRAAADLARTLRDAGMEIVFAGGSQTLAQIAATAVQEDAAAVVMFGAGEEALTLPGVTIFASAASAESIVSWAETSDRDPGSGR
jgi:methylmalonyl-CoA mutase cobalamin-binding domain/chain